MNFQLRINLESDLAHFRGESATSQIKKYVAAAVDAWTSPGIFQQNKEKHDGSTRIKIALNNFGLYPSLM